jgi:hypothetical protein
VQLPPRHRGRHHKDLPVIVRHVAARLLVAAALAGAGGPALAGRPLQTEDADILDRGECELESFWARASESDAPRVRALSAQIGCGIGARTQLAVAAARARGGDVHSDALALTGKTALRQLTDAQTALTLAYMLSGARVAGGSFRHDATEVRAVLSMPMVADAWLLHANLGGARSETQRINSTVWSAAIERTGIGRFDLMAEVFGDDRSAPWWNTGLRYTAIASLLFVDVSYGAQLRGGRPKLLTAGLKYTF